MSVKAWRGVIRNPRAVGWMVEILAKATSLIVLLVLPSAHCVLQVVRDAAVTARV